MRCIELCILLHDEGMFDLILETLLKVEIRLLQEIPDSLDVFSVERLIEVCLIAA